MASFWHALTLGDKYGNGDCRSALNQPQGLLVWAFEGTGPAFERFVFRGLTRRAYNEAGNADALAVPRKDPDLRTPAIQGASRRRTAHVH